MAFPTPCLHSLSVQVILGKGVDEGRILFLTLIAAPEGIHRICRTFPRVKVPSYPCQTHEAAGLCLPVYAPGRLRTGQNQCCPDPQSDDRLSWSVQRGATAGKGSIAGMCVQLQVITSEIDEGIDERTYQVVPGALLLSSHAPSQGSCFWRLHGGSSVLQWAPRRG